jgi:hypothetical protein
MRKSMNNSLERQRRKEFLAACNRAYEALRNDPKAWAEELAERAEWECTLADGLDNEVDLHA